MNISHKVQIISLMVLFLISEHTFGLKMNKMSEEIQTQNKEPQERTFSLKLPLLQPDYHWTFMSKKDFLAGKLLLNISRDEKKEEIVIFENGSLSEGWKEMDEEPKEGWGEIYFGFISAKKYLTAPGDKLELVLSVTKALPGIGAEQSGILPAGVYKSTGTYSGLLDGFESTALGKQLLEKEVITEEEQKQIDVLRSALEYKAFLENWNEQWSLKITRNKGWLSDEQLLKLDETRSRLLNSANQSKPYFFGTVLDEQGKPVSDASVVAHTPLTQKTITDKDGKIFFDKKINTQTVLKISSEEITPYLVIRQRERNLATIVDLEGNTESLEVKLSPGRIASGKVVNEKGEGIQDAKFNLVFIQGTVGLGGEEPVSVDENGNFQIKAIPTEYKFSITAEANDYGRETSEIYANNDTEKNFELGTIVLPVANMSLSGIVVDTDDKPVPDARLTCSGAGQRYLNLTSDENGKYKFEKLIPGIVNISATKTNFGMTSSDQKQYYGSTQTEAGSTNVRVVISEAPERVTGLSKVQSVSLINKPLPRIENLFKGFIPEKIKDKSVLVCFWDYEQRPSRNSILQLLKMANQLHDKNIEVIAIHVSNIELSSLDQWRLNNNITFPIGVIDSDEEKVRAQWGIKSLPWLILTDKNHKVTAEGFSISELDEKLGNN